MARKKAISPKEFANEMVGMRLSSIDAIKDLRKSDLNVEK